MVLRRLFGGRDKQVQNKELDYLNKVMALSFQKVKEDTANIFKWVDYLYRQNLHQKSVIAHLHNQLKGTVKKSEIHSEIMPHVRQHTKAEVQTAVAGLQQNLQQQNAYQVHATQRQSLSIEVVHKKVSALEKDIETRLSALHKIQKKIDNHGAAFDTISERFKTLSSRPAVVEKQAPQKSGLKSTVLKSITRNSKEYIKGIILSLVNKYSQVQGIELRKMVVEEQALCSKSSLYRLLEELEHEQNIGVVRQGKEKLYITNTIKKSVEQ